MNLASSYALSPQGVTISSGGEHVSVSVLVPLVDLHRLISLALLVADEATLEYVEAALPGLLDRARSNSLPGE